MPYVVHNTEGNIQLVIQDGRFDDSTGLTLVGRGYTGYGEFMADNFIRLLENFASAQAPTNPLIGQIWFDKTTSILNYWDGSQWNRFAEEGPRGYAGSQGPQGPTGPQGYAGELGYTGSIGYTGSQGIQGFTGYIGSIGDIGYTGSVGYTGSRGIAGEPGADSTVPGPIGFTGSRGYIGSKGDVGYVGSQGVQGPTGPIGPDGPSGLPGPRGPTGPGISGNLSIADQTISGTILNEDLVFNPLGDGAVVTNSNFVPAVDTFLDCGASSARWAAVYTDTVYSNVFQTGVPPSTSIGSDGDRPGQIAFDQNYFYYCFSNYTGTTDIWRRVAWNNSSW